MSALLAVSAGAAPAQTASEFRCAELKPSASEQPPYQRASAQARCEGFYDRNVSQPFIELVSLTTGPVSAPPAGEALQLSASRRQAARVVVHPLRPGPFYRVDALVEAGQALRWDAAPMLGATGLRLRDLGFLALALAPRDDTTMTLLPLSIGSSAMLLAAPAPSLTGKAGDAAGAAAAVVSGVGAVGGVGGVTAGVGAAGASLQAVLRVSVPVASMSWRRYRVDGGGVAGGDAAAAWREIPGPARFAWERVPLAIELPADGSGLRIDVQAVDASGQTLPLLRFVVIGPADVAR